MILRSEQSCKLIIVVLLQWWQLAHLYCNVLCQGLYMSQREDVFLTLPESSQAKEKCVDLLSHLNRMNLDDHIFFVVIIQ